MPRYVVGFHAIEAYLKKNPARAVMKVAQKNRRIEELVRFGAERGASVEHTTMKALDDLSLAGEHRGLVLELCGDVEAAYSSFDEFLGRFDGETGVVLALDGVTDVHNLGAVLRSCDLFGVDAVLLPARRSAKNDEIVAKVSSGASAFVSVLEVSNLVRGLEALKEKGFWIFGADMNGCPACEADMKGKTCLVMGSEGKGLSRLASEHCDVLVRVPSRGHVDSFNVSVAAGILLYEIRRQQGFPAFNLR